MGIKTILTCNAGGEELAVERSDAGEIVFRTENKDDLLTVYVTNDEARQFAETILRVVNG